MQSPKERRDIASTELCCVGPMMIMSATRAETLLSNSFLPTFESLDTLSSAGHLCRLLLNVVRLNNILRGRSKWLAFARHFSASTELYGLNRLTVENRVLLLMDAVA
jgi:hypothetical protein